ncbi:MAG TPA: hypothetical protein VKT21_01665, partial [Thermoplasmata archaeon]|nr:hypothetical protein [Thermoplasmata archaeon]
IGFYKLKVKDREVCKRCTTLDCAKSCPVGLVDMPGRFRTTGEFRSGKCCGVGNCVGACPYDNLYIYDVRHWLRGRLSGPPSLSTGARLPVLPVAPRRTDRTPVPPPGAAPRTYAPEAGSP